MRINYVHIVIFILTSAFAKAQLSTRDYRRDSLQFKIYTRLYVNDQLRTDSVKVKKVFCDWCSDKQIAMLQEEALRQTTLEQYNPKYKKQGEHRLALYIRLSKEVFKEIDKLE